MRYLEASPISVLKPFVQKLWLLDLSGAPQGPDSEPQRILPDGRPELVVHYGELCQEILPNGKRVKQSRSLLVGQMRRSVLLAPSPGAGMVGVRFKPSGAKHFLKDAMAAFSGQIVGLSEFSGELARKLEDRVQAARTDPERFTRIQACLVEVLYEVQPDRLVLRMLELLPRAPSLGQLYENLGVSERQAERRFQTGVGLTPKLYSRVARFQTAVQAIQARPGGDLASLAQTAGYFDQAHFNHEFKAFAGLSPKAYLTELHPVSDHFTRT